MSADLLLLLLDWGWLSWAPPKEVGIEGDTVSAAALLMQIRVLAIAVRGFGSVGPGSVRVKGFGFQVPCARSAILGCCHVDARDCKLLSVLALDVLDFS